MIYGKDHWWEIAIELEEKRSELEAKYPNVGKAPDEDYMEYVLITNLLGPIYQYLQEGEL